MESAVRHPPERHWYIISYDVSDDKRRSKVAKCLEGYGERLQFSVFRTFLSRRLLARLRFEICQKMDDTDGLLIIHLCPSCQSRIQDKHGSKDWRAEAPLGFKITGNVVKYLP
jgi:CRISPR-associated protein Cas2